MAESTLQADIRQELGTGASNRARRSGLVPCVVYGLGKENIPLSIPRNKLEPILATGAQMLDVAFGNETESALVKDLQYHPITGKIIHMDLERVAMDEEVTIEVPITLKGRATGVEEGGVLDHLLHSLEVSCLPASIPEEIVVDVAELAINDSVKVESLELPSGVTTAVSGDEMVAIVHPPAAEEDETLSDEEEGASAEPEVLTAAQPKEEEADGDEKGSNG